MQTKGNPSPTRAQLASFRISLNLSTVGEVWFGGGKTASLHKGHLYPAGAVFGGRLKAHALKQCQ